VCVWALHAVKIAASMMSHNTFVSVVRRYCYILLWNNPPYIWTAKIVLGLAAV
jgi:hypothetical protein